MTFQNVLLVRRMSENKQLQLRMKNCLTSDETLGILKVIASHYVEMERENMKTDQIHYILQEAMESAVEEASL